MTVQQAIDLGIGELTKAHTHDPEGCANFLLRHVLDESLEQITLVEPGRQLTKEQEKKYRDMLLRRKLREPVWYITNEAFFWHDPFYVDGRVLIPRPETELLVETVLDFVKQSLPKRSRVIDVGTGSGAIAISLFKELRTLDAVDTFYASDVSPEAIEVAKRNAGILDVPDIQFLIGDALEPLKKKVDLIIGNPPYVPTETVGGLSYDIHHFEPRVALDGGKDGLDIHRKILKQAKTKLKQGGAIFLEIGHDQGNACKKIAQEVFPEAQITILKDYDANDRILSLRLISSPLR